MKVIKKSIKVKEASLKKSKAAEKDRKPIKVSSSPNLSTPILVGAVTHYYSNLGVGVVKVKKELKLGDALQISGRGKSFAQKAQSMQLEHQPISVAKKGHLIGLKVNKAVKAKDLLYKFA